MADRIYPQPDETPTNAPMLDAWRMGRFMVQRCRACERAFYYPRSMCPHCWSADLEWIEAQGPGKIVSFTRVMRPLHDVFADEAPVVLAEIDMPDGFRLLARVLCEDPSALAAGQNLSLIPPDQAPQFPLPTFMAG